MPSARTNEPNWTKIWTETVGSRGDERRERRDVIRAEAAVGVRGKDGHGRGADMTEVALVVFAIECLETFAAKFLIDLRERPRTIGPFVELIDEAAEHLRRVAS